jgi:ubiquinone/menaquinone biosynthesis C-methylase UbiE
MSAPRGDGLEVETAYEGWAPFYDEVENPTRDLDAAVVRRMLADAPGDAALELGCGTGKNTGFLAERFGAVVAVDVSAAMLERAGAKLRRANVQLVRHDIRKPWPCADGRFDLVACNLVLEHIDDLRPVYREAARVLRPGGRFFLCEIHPYRQLQGAQARLSRPGCAETVPIRAYPHSTADYLNAGIAAGLRARHHAEWHGEGDAVPRLLSVLFES